MSDYMPEGSFSLEDIVREFGSGSDLLPEAATEAMEAELLLPEEPEKLPQERAHQNPQGKNSRSAPRTSKKTAHPAAVFHGHGKRPRPERLPSVPKKLRSAERIVREAGRRERSLALRLRICFVVTVVNCLLAVYNGLDLQWFSGFENLSAMGVISLILLLVAMGVAYDVCLSGLRRIGRGDASAELLISVLCILSIPEAIIAIRAGRLPFCSLISLEVLCALWAWQRQNRSLRLDALMLMNSPDAIGVKRAENAWHGEPAAVCAAADLENFETMLEAEDPQRSWMRRFVPVVLLASILLSLVCAIKVHINFLWLWTALLLAATPLSCFLSYALPYSLLADRLSQHEAALCGWYGAKVLDRCEAVFLHDVALFPGECRRLTGIKVFEGYNTDQVTRYAVAVLHAAGCEIASLLPAPEDSEILVNELRCYDEGGFGAQINKDTVLVGTLGFLKRMGVHLEKGAKIRQALYVAISGELAGIIALHYEASAAVGDALAALSGESAPIPVLMGGEVLIGPAMLRAKYRLSLERLACPTLRERMTRPMAQETSPQGALLSQPEVEALSDVCLGAKALVSAVRASMVLSLLASVFGIIIVCILAISNVLETVSCAQMLAYFLVWGIPFSIAAVSVLRKKS